MKKKQSQLFTYAEILKNNKDIFSKQYPRMEGEPNEHFICKVFFGEQLRKYYAPKIDLVINYEYPLPPLETGNGLRSYIPDIFVEHTDNKQKVIRIAIVETNGNIHYATKKQYQKGRLRRETILKYFKEDYVDIRNPEYEIVFSYIVFDNDSFLYHQFDHFQQIFEDCFITGKIYPEVNAYERYLLR